MGKLGVAEEENTENDEYSPVGMDLSDSWDKQEDADVEETDEALAEEPEAGAEEILEEREIEPLAAESELAGETDTSSPPTGLDAQAREAWKTTPLAMQKAIAKREKQFSVQIQKNSEAAKRAESMDRALAPYQQYIQMNGGSQHIGNLLQTGANLQMGSPIQKAQMVADLIKTYAIDIGTLDSMIVGAAPPPQVQEKTAIQQGINEALAPFAGLMTDMQQREAQGRAEQQGQVASTVSSFGADPKNEFYEDVKMDMADLMDMAANRGQGMSMEDAYKRACMMNDGISNVIQSRTSASDIASKIAASASIAGSPGGPGGANPANNMADTIRDAWDNTGRV